MRAIVFEGENWSRYEELREKDRRLHRSLCKILKELQHGDPVKGLGKPESLKHNLTGLWSRWISSQERLIYSFDERSIYILAIGRYYDLTLSERIPLGKE